MNINTTKSISTASIAYSKELEDTKKNLLAKCKAIGMDTDKKNLVNIRINKTIDIGDDVLWISINGMELYFKRGDTYDVPVDVKDFLDNVGE